MGDITNCQCYTVQLSKEAQDYLQKTCYDCLCRNCMIQIEQMVKFSLLHSFPAQKELMVEGLHYYRENGQIVFTELYHLQRGYCCHNGCRRCAYGCASPSDNSALNKENDE